MENWESRESRADTCSQIGIGRRSRRGAVLRVDALENRVNTCSQRST